MRFFSIIILSMFFLPLGSAAHFITGIVNDAGDRTSADGHIVTLWNPSEGISDNLTDTIGSSGNSGAENVYMIDCELLSNPCTLNDELNIRVINTGDNYISETANVTVTGAGYDIADNITLNSPPNITSLTVDDSLKSPENQIDLTAATSKTIKCQAVILDYDGEASIKNASAEFFDSSSYYGDSDDNNYHYTNQSCILDTNYGNENETLANCSFQVWYYANSDNWECFVKTYDNLTVSGNKSDSVFINPLLAVGIDTTIDFGEIYPKQISNESSLNITNYGNIRINISLSGYAVVEGDGYAMNCTLGNEIPVYYQKYNLTDSNNSEITLEQSESLYNNLTKDPEVKEFNLDYNTNDTENHSRNTTYWRVYLPLGTGGDCTGNIVFGASKAPET
jgi:hypothetical protein